MKNAISIILFFLITPFLLDDSFHLKAQTPPKWDDTQSKYWPKEAKTVKITSSKDGEIQHAYVYQATGNAPRPLIVSLHTWSGDFQQRDTLVQHCIRNNYHYIHPDFRGPNHTNKALGSDWVISDIDDAITYCLQNVAVDPSNIHVIGVSGGGHATVLAYMKSKHTIRSFSAYVGIYNLIDWYHESMGRKNKYGHDILAATTEPNLPLNIEEVKKRSPFYLPTPTEKRRHSKLNLYVGIHDGYTGSVPITQSFHMYNKLVLDFQPDAKTALIPEEYIRTMVKERSLPGFESTGSILGRKIIYQNNYKHLINITVFEGTHEMPPTGNPLAHVPSKQILAIGDSNGAANGGWVDQLQSLRPNDLLINTCVSGNTIGFDNLDQEQLNTLKNVEKYINKTSEKIDVILVMLGTNDSKAIFKNNTKEVPVNLEKLINTIKSLVANKPQLGDPKIYIISPPPFASDEQLTSKYTGGAARTANLSIEFQKVATKTKVNYINSHALLKPIFSYLSNDGVHLTSAGQILLAKIINEELEK